jgi:hypothetical protein
MKFIKILSILFCFAIRSISGQTNENLLYDKRLELKALINAIDSNVTAADSSFKAEYCSDLKLKRELSILKINIYLTRIKVLESLTISFLDSYKELKLADAIQSIYQISIDNYCDALSYLPKDIIFKGAKKEKYLSAYSVYGYGKAAIQQELNFKDIETNFSRIDTSFSNLIDAQKTVIQNIADVNLNVDNKTKGITTLIDSSSQKLKTIINKTDSLQSSTDTGFAATKKLLKTVLDKIKLKPDNTAKNIINVTVYDANLYSFGVYRLLFQSKEYNYFLGGEYIYLNKNDTSYNGLMVAFGIQYKNFVFLPALINDGEDIPSKKFNWNLSIIFVKKGLELGLSYSPFLGAGLKMGFGF